MPVFATPEPISATVELAIGDVRVVAGERTDTTVDVRPSNPGNPHDVKAADQTQVDFDGSVLTVRGPKYRGLMFGKAGSIEITVELPAGSAVHGTTAMGDLRSEGRLGDCRFKTATGTLEIEETTRLEADSGTGDVTVHHASGHAELHTGAGDLRVHEIDGTAVLKNSGGDCLVGDVTGAVRISSASGDIEIGRAHAAVTAKTASGDVRIAEVMRDAVVLDTAAGDIEIGIREGSAAWLVLNTMTGQVHNSLTATDGPGGTDATVEVRARTYTGDIHVRRS